MATQQRPILRAGSDICTIEDEQGQSDHFPRYRHDPLPAGRKIRLLGLERQTKPWPLSSLSKMNEFSLIEYELENTETMNIDVSNSPYITISYSWGEAVFDVPLIIVSAGQRSILPATATAWEAVQRVVPAIAAGQKYIWIDQICINQHDAEEKGRQVSLMGEIFRRCWHCIIWLGPSDTNTDAGFKLLKRLQEAFPHTQSIPIDQNHTADLSHGQIRAELAGKLGRDLLPHASDPGWTEIARLLHDRSWFTRLWTFQEAILCYKGDASVCCGPCHASFFSFMRAALFLGHEKTFGGIDFTSGRAALAQISTCRFHVENGQVTPLIWLLQNNRLRNCMDPRDRVYAMLGLRREDGPEYPIQADYDISSAKYLYIETARKIIRSKNSLRVCAESAERVPDGGIAGLPSWVPDWTRQPLVSTFELLNPASFYFKASDSRIHNDIVEASHMLSARGKIVDTVKEVTGIEVPDALTLPERRSVLVDSVIPQLLARLQAKVPGMAPSKLAYIAVDTLTVGGYTRTNNIGSSGLLANAWTESTCGDMLRFVLGPAGSVARPQLDIDPEMWLHALTREAAHCTNREFAVLENNSLALIPAASIPNDFIAILHGSSLPFVLRPANKGSFTLIGPCYVHGIMHGEAVDWSSGDVIQIC